MGRVTDRGEIDVRARASPAAVLLIHGSAQVWPWIALAYSVVPWFLWLGGGGILLIVLAARYEQRIANFKSVSLCISARR